MKRIYPHPALANCSGGFTHSRAVVFLTSGTVQPQQRTRELLEKLRMLIHFLQLEQQD